MDVSIVINNYNYEDYIGSAIESALGQEYENTEVIVVDDGSEDRSRDVIRSYAPRIRARFKTNGGQASAINEGFEASRGDVIFFLDADDVLYPSAAGRVVEEWSSGTAKAHFRLQCIDRDGNSLDRIIPRRTNDLAEGNLIDHISVWGGYQFPPTTGNAFHVSVLKKILPIPEEEYRVCADNYLALMAPLHGNIFAVDEVLGGYRYHDQNRWSNRSDFLDIDNLKGRLYFRVKKANIVKNKYPSPNIRHHKFNITEIEEMRLDGIRKTEDVRELFESVAEGCRRVWALYRDSWKMSLFWTAWLVVAAFGPRFVSIRLIALQLMPNNQHPEWLRFIRRLLKR